MNWYFGFPSNSQLAPNIGMFQIDESDLQMILM